MTVVGVATVHVVIGGKDWAIQLPPAADLTDTTLMDKLTTAIEGIKGLASDG